MYAENQYTPLGLLALCSLLKQPGLYYQEPSNPKLLFCRDITLGYDIY